MGGLTQEQIDAMLNGGNTDNTGDTSAEEVTSIDSTREQMDLSEYEIDILRKIYSESMVAAAKAISSNIKMKVDITTPRVEVVKSKDVMYRSLEPAIAVEIRYTEGIKGLNTFILSQDDILKIVDIMMGGLGQVDESVEFTELHISAIGEVMNQMMGASAIALNKYLKTKIDISPPVTYKLNDQHKVEDRNSNEDDNVLLTRFKFIVSDIINSEMILTASIEFARDMVSKRIAAMQTEISGVITVDGDNESLKISESDSLHVNPPQIPEPEPVRPAPAPREPERKSSETGGIPPKKKVIEEPVNAKPVEFSNFDDSAEGLIVEGNLELILDLPLSITVEIGRTKKLVQEVIDYGEGSIIELDKQAGEPVDIFANGNLIAKGTVIVIEENFGVKITEIVSNQEKIKIAKNS